MNVQYAHRKATIYAPVNIICNAVRDTCLVLAWFVERRRKRRSLMTTYVMSFMDEDVGVHAHREIDSVEE